MLQRRGLRPRRAPIAQLTDKKSPSKPTSATDTVHASTSRDDSDRHSSDKMSKAADKEKSKACTVTKKTVEADATAKESGVKSSSDRDRDKQSGSQTPKSGGAESSRSGKERDRSSSSGEPPLVIDLQQSSDLDEDVASGSKDRPGPKSAVKKVSREETRDKRDDGGSKTRSRSSEKRHRSRSRTPPCTVSVSREDLDAVRRFIKDRSRSRKH